MIRRAEFSDIDGIVELGGFVFERSPYSGRFRWDETEAKLQLARALADRNDCLVLVSERNERIDGFVVAGTFELPFSSTRYVSDMALVAEDGSGGWLLRRMLKWARGRGLPVLASAGAGGDRKWLYIRSGMTPVGELFVG